MISNVIDQLEHLRYKYLSAKHDGPPITQDEMSNDMLLIIYILQTMLDPFAAYKSEIRGENK